MTTPITSQNTNQTGLCPHGLPPAMCPICSKMMAGAMKKKDKPAQTKPVNTGEWSYMKCYVEGLRIRARMQAAEHKKDVLLRQIEALNKMSFKISEFVQKLNAKLDALPPIAKPLATVILNVIVAPILTFIAQIPKMISQITQQIVNLGEKISQLLSQLTSSIAEKLSSLLGEIKNFIKSTKEKSTKERLKDIFLFFVDDTKQTTVGESTNDTNERE